MGGPFWKNKDHGAWGIPKGLLNEGEDPIAAAIRECEEEIGHRPKGDLFSLGDVKTKEGKVIHVWCCEHPLKEEINFKSNTFQMEFPKGSGLKETYPELTQGKLIWISNSGHLYEKHFDTIKRIIEKYYEVKENDTVIDLFNDLRTMRLK